MRRNMASCLLVCLTSILGCGDSTDQPVDPGGETVTLTLTPTSGSMGSLVEITGLDGTSIDPADLEVFFGDQAAVARVTAGGAILATVPVPLDPDGTVAAASATALDVRVDVAASTVGETKAGFTVTALPVAPGAVSDVATAFASIVDDVEAIALALAPTPSLEEGYATALFAAARQLITDPSRGLIAQVDSLATSDPEALAVLEGILAASGALDRLQEVSTILAGLELEDPDEVERRITELTDDDLAARMQLYVMVRDVGQQVIGATATTWGSWLAPVFGGISFVGVGGTVAAPGVALAGTIGTVLGLINTAVNNVALAYLPANVDRFELRVLEPTVAPGEVASTEIWIEASNNPSTITTLDLVNLVLTGMGILPGSLPAGHPRRVALIQTIDYFLGIFRGLLSSYGQQNPGSDLAFDVASIPSMSWTARVDDTRYVQPLSFTPDVIDANEFDILAWRAAIDGRGEGRIYARIQTGPDVTSLVQIPGVTYASGAFGDDVRTTETQTVIVQPEFRVEASMAAVIAPGGANALEVVAGYDDGEGGIDGAEGIQIQLSADGGSVDESSGTTDADGSFITLARLGNDSSSITIEVTATDSLGNTASASVTASTGNPLTGVSRHSFVSARTRIDFVPDGANYDCDEADDGSFDGFGPLVDTRQADCAADYEGEPVVLSASATQTSDVELREENPGLDVLLRATGSGTVDNSYTQSAFNTTGSNRSTARTFFRLDFVVNGTPLQIDYDCLSQIPQPYAGGYARIYLLGPGSEFVFDRRTHSTLGGGAIARGSEVLQPGSYTLAINLNSLGSFSDAEKNMEFEIEIDHPD